MSRPTCLCASQRYDLLVAGAADLPELRCARYAATGSIRGLAALARGSDQQVRRSGGVQADPASVFLYRGEARDVAEALGIDCRPYEGPIIPP
jgi:hypothetical protein